MYSIAFPEMFSNSKTNLVYNHDATLNNLKLLLGAEIGELFGDPGFGALHLKAYLFEQNSNIIPELLIDQLYTSISVFMPQLIVDRNDITLSQRKNKIYVTIKALNKIDYQLDIFDIQLLNAEE